jgi:hypothetical protein
MPLLARRHLPNTITVMRLVLAGGFFATLGVFRYPDHNVAWGNVALVVFILAVVTDAVDGYLARRWEVVSTFGRIMDPFCDKVLVLGAFVDPAAPAHLVPETGRPATAATSRMEVVLLAREHTEPWLPPKQEPSHSNPFAYHQAGAHFATTENGWITYTLPKRCKDRVMTSSNHEPGTTQYLRSLFQVGLFRWSCLSQLRLSSRYGSLILSGFPFCSR